MGYCNIPSTAICPPELEIRSVAAAAAGAAASMMLMLMLMSVAEKLETERRGAQLLLLEMQLGSPLERGALGPEQQRQGAEIPQPCPVILVAVDGVAS